VAGFATAESLAAGLAGRVTVAGPHRNLTGFLPPTLIGCSPYLKHSAPVGKTTTRLVLIRHASTEAVRRGAFPLDEPLDAQGAAAASAAAAGLPRSDIAFCGPSAAARQTAAGLGLDARLDGALEGCDYGAWRGLAPDQVAPEELALWIADPQATPHGGESVAAVVARVSAWLQERTSEPTRIIAVTHAEVIRAAVLLALDAPLEAFWRIDVAPLGRTVLHHGGRHWTLRATGA